MTKRRDVIVVGAGISGLTTAFYLARGGLAVTLLDAGERVGGALDTRREGEWLVELGPNTVAERPALAALVQHCGLGSRRLQPSPAAARRYVWHRGALRALPASPPQLLASSLLSVRGKVALLREPWVPPRRAADVGGAGADESVAAFARRRLGEEALEVFLAPFVAGIYAGDPERLSMRWTLPRLAALEQQHGSLLRGARASRRQGAVAFRHPIVTFDDGLATLAERLASFVPDLRRGSRADAVRRDGDGFVVDTAAGPLAAPRVVLAVPAPQAACLLFPASDGLSAPLAELPYAPLAVLACGFRRQQVAHRLDGFGFLAAPSSGLRLLGCLFTSSVFPHRAPAGHVLLTTFLGGRQAPELLEQNDESLIAIAREDLERTLGARGEPVLTVLRRWPRALPQLELGHERFVALAAGLESAMPGLRLVGNWLEGTGVADCVARAAAVAEAMLASRADFAVAAAASAAAAADDQLDG
ncbi:MAG TPA: protoporphyrinogen oxidase [Thermoanaerobaculia bacterium]|nr:protoporphyrinogen oxidase [Thermoanaerobaculia bacterium]